ncbi:hypothetical protein FE783_17990 [Paenibacillus mesophilus]|uniref:glycosyl hydrolase family 28-related protein n=1 Tax=Paenibacillus mesophilus TaxID=2582849 RepID=UPI00110E4534|nr:glycosyl hydrolase family 28-related protein [Paenibacillus mesophilus]TMV48406.1 hypothetical protein FE783_17990 [Paenibacillus mesophilus]
MADNRKQVGLEHDEELQQGHAISRRGLLASIGAAGVAFAAGGIWRAGYTEANGQTTVQQATYGVLNVKEQGALGDGVNDDTAAVQSAIDLCAGGGGGIVFLPPGIYKLTNTLTMRSGVALEGAGVGAWDIPFPNRTKQRAATELRFTGTGPKSYEVAYVTDMHPSGGVLVNTDTLPNHADSAYRLTNFRNADASGSGPASTKPFSVALYAPKGCQFAAIRNLRIVPNFNGLDGYNDKNTFALGDEWDVGVFLDNAQDILVHNVQIVGYWRIAATLITAGSLGAENTNAGAERNRFYDCTFQGVTGLCVRGGDLYRSTAFGGSAGNYTLEIPWWSSSPLPQQGKVRLANKVFDYTSTTVSGDRITLHGLSSNPADTANVGDEVRLSPYSTGFAGTAFVNCYIGGLEHSSKRAACHTAIGMGVSKNIEMSGYPLRGFKFISCTIQGHEDILLHLHDAFDVQFIGSYFESGARYDGVLGGGRIIAAPWRNSAGARGPYPCGQTNNIYFLATEFSSVDKMPKFKRQSGVRYTDGGFFQPRYSFDSYETMPQRTEQDFVLKAPNNQRVRLQNGEGKDALGITPGANIEVHGNLNKVSGSFIAESNDGHELRVKGDAKLKISAAGTADFAGAIVPKTDNTADLGAAGKRWANVHVADGIVMTTPDGTGKYKVYVDNDGQLRTSPL